MTDNLLNARIASATIVLDDEHAPRVVMALKSSDETRTLVSGPVGTDTFLRDLILLFGPFDSLRGRVVRVGLGPDGGIDVLADAVEDMAVRVRPMREVTENPDTEEGS